MGDRKAPREVDRSQVKPPPPPAPPRKRAPLTFDEQLRACDHRPFTHNVLTGCHECLCGKTAIPLRGVCPVLVCLCGLPKSE